MYLWGKCNISWLNNNLEKFSGLNVIYLFHISSVCSVPTLLPDSSPSHVWPHAPHSLVLQVANNQTNLHSLFSYIQQYCSLGWNCYCAQCYLHFSCQGEKVRNNKHFQIEIKFFLFQIFWSSKMASEFLFWIHGKSFMLE